VVILAAAKDLSSNSSQHFYASVIVGPLLAAPQLAQAFNAPRTVVALAFEFVTIAHTLAR
jgi:hypothetical protein